MPRPCSICNDPNAVAITQALSNGVPTKRVAAQFGVAAASLFRHKKSCLGGTIPPPASITQQASRTAAALAILPERDALASAYEALRQRAETITQKAEDAGSLAVAIGGLREVRSTLDSIGKLAGYAGSGTQVNVQTNVAVGIDAAAIQALVQAITTAPDRGDAIGHLAAVVDAVPVE